MQTTGNSSPLGATVGHGGVNFSLFSRDARGVEVLFGEPSSVQLLLAWNVVQHLGVVTISAKTCVRRVP